MGKVYKCGLPALKEGGNDAHSIPESDSLLEPGFQGREEAQKLNQFSQIAVQRVMWVHFIIMLHHLHVFMFFLHVSNITEFMRGRNS